MLAGGGGDLAMAINWSDNCYHTEDFECTGLVHTSARVGVTSCRAPGVIQSVALHEYSRQTRTLLEPACSLG